MFSVICRVAASRRCCAPARSAGSAAYAGKAAYALLAIRRDVDVELPGAQLEDGSECSTLADCTTGEKETRAWTFKAGMTAPQAAGVIHTDFEKAFIRAEVYAVQDLVDHESETAIRAAGKLRTEGRDYVMREGDVCHFLIGK